MSTHLPPLELAGAPSCQPLDSLGSWSWPVQCWSHGRGPACPAGFPAPRLLTPWPPPHATAPRSVPYPARSAWLYGGRPPAPPLAGPHAAASPLPASADSAAHRAVVPREDSPVLMAATPASNHLGPWPSLPTVLGCPLSPPLSAPWAPLQAGWAPYCTAGSTARHRAERPACSTYTPLHPVQIRVPVPPIGFAVGAHSSLQGLHHPLHQPVCLWVITRRPPVRDADRCQRRIELPPKLRSLISQHFAAGTHPGEHLLSERLCHESGTFAAERPHLHPLADMLDHDQHVPLAAPAEGQFLCHVQRPAETQSSDGQRLQLLAALSQLCPVPVACFTLLYKLPHLPC
ncbi:unnamed protein product [Closterium sp. NIES-54]